MVLTNIKKSISINRRNNYLKKILITLVTVLLALVPINALAEENVENQTIELIATKASTYKVKLPKTVDISPNTSTFNIVVAGEISSDKKIVISYDATDLKLVDQSTHDKNEDIPLTISLSNNEFINTDLTAEFEDATKVATFTCTHGDLKSGLYKASLPVVIALVDR